jgi:hypothetical protein
MPSRMEAVMKYLALVFTTSALLAGCASTAPASNRTAIATSPRGMSGRDASESAGAPPTTLALRPMPQSYVSDATRAQHRAIPASATAALGQ